METALAGTLLLVPSYVYWHYAKATKHIWRLAGDFSWFLWNFFSIGLLARTFFKPWWREAEHSHAGAMVFFSADALEGYLATKVGNAIVLIFGVIVRGVVIVVGLIAEALLWIGTVVFFLIWLVLPALLLYFLFAGIVFLLRPL